MNFETYNRKRMEKLIVTVKKSLQDYFVRLHKAKNYKIYLKNKDLDFLNKLKLAKANFHLTKDWKFFL